MMELLAGPFDVTRVFDDVIIPLSSSPHTSNTFYEDDIGLAKELTGTGPGGSGYYIIQLDGTAHSRGGALSGYGEGGAYLIDMQRPGEYLVTTGLFNDSIYLFDKHVGRKYGTSLIAGGINFVGGLHVRADERWVSTLASAVRHRPLDNLGSWIPEATLVGAGTGEPAYSRTKNPDVMCLIYVGGQGLYYDVVARQQVGTTFNIGTNQGAWYSAKHNVFVAFVSSKVRIYANAVRPATLSNPTATLLHGRTSTVTVRLTGTNTDACVGELIGWNITAGDGVLTKAQSITDASGYATNTYVAPLTGGSNPTIQATVVF